MSVPIVLQKQHCVLLHAAYSCRETSDKERQYNTENYLHFGTSQRQKSRFFPSKASNNTCERNAFYTEKIQGKDNCQMVFTNVTFYKN